MTVVLAATYHPRGEINRLRRLYPLLQAIYTDIVISMPPSAQAEDVDAVKMLPNARAFVNTEWPQGRYTALKKSLETDASHMHYADMDRLLRWVEIAPDELRQTVAQVERSDCLVIGRTGQAWETHPQALRQTEKISNSVFSALLGQELDLSAGSKSFSRRAVEFLMVNTLPKRALGADSEWIVVLHRAGFKVESILVNGLEWETADRYSDQAADAETQRRAAEIYDTDAQHWAMRVGVALEIVQAGLDAMGRELKEV
jgi:hypothetical protein